MTKAEHACELKHEIDSISTVGQARGGNSRQFLLLDVIYTCSKCRLNKQIWVISAMDFTIDEMERPMLELVKEKLQDPLSTMSDDLQITTTKTRLNYCLMKPGL